jgi:hypothetical protein
MQRRNKRTTVHGERWDDSRACTRQQVQQQGAAAGGGTPRETGLARQYWRDVAAQDSRWHGRAEPVWWGLGMMRWQPLTNGAG